MTDQTNSPEYEATSQAHREASAAFTIVQHAYRDLDIGDDEYLAGRAIFDTTTAAFDIAFDIEANKAIEEVDAQVEDDPQLELHL